jgi:uncharacterized protein (TIGR03083 family)
VSEQLAAAYHDLRTRVSDLVRAAGPDALDTEAPAAPDWRIRDVVAHLSGVCADITTGNLAGVATDEWTAAQVETRRDWPVERLLTEWDEEGAAVDTLIPSFPAAIATQLLVDAATHEQDIRGGLGTPGSRDSDAAVALMFPGAVEHFLAPGLQVECDEGTYLSGGADGVEVTVRAPRFELFRAMTGRRSLDQIRAFDWTPESRPEALVIGIFTARPTPLVEEHTCCGATFPIGSRAQPP